MATSLTVLSNLQKHKIATADPWYLLLQVDLPDGVTHRYFAHNPEDVNYGGHTYIAFAFDLEPIYDKASGELQAITLWVSNVTRYMQADLEQYDGGVEATVTLRVVSKADLTGAPAMELSFDITFTTSDARRVTFTLGADSPLRRAFPRYLYLEDYCIWKYKGAQCGYAGGLATCSHRIDGADGCRAHNNSLRFGGFPGIDAQGFRLASVV